MAENAKQRRKASDAEERVRVKWDSGLLWSMHRDLTAESAAQLLLFECTNADLKFWTNALNTLAETMEMEPLKVREFMETLASVIPGIEHAHIGDVITMDLSLGEKCFVAAAIGAFVDLWICSGESDLTKWMSAWAHTAETLVSAGALVRQDSSYIDAVRMSRVWNSIRAAIS